MIPKTEWVVDGNDDTIIQLQGHKFAARDTGGPMLCSMFCAAQGRHPHIDFCRSLSHITKAIQPVPEKPKDWITHKLHWQRLGVCISTLTLFILTSSAGRFQRYPSAAKLA
jgi:hypothetical protein